MVASWSQVVVVAPSSRVAEVENHPLVVVVLDLVASACLAVEQAFFQVEVVQVEGVQMAVVQALAACHLQLVAVLQNMYTKII